MDSLAEQALDLALIRRPEADPAPYQRHLDGLVAEVRQFIAGKEVTLDLAGKADALAEILARRYGYGGNPETYDELESACLMTTIDRRHGLPVALGILYIAVARDIGWDAAGLSFPGHFLIRLAESGRKGERRVLMDPFNGGTILEPHDLRGLLKQIAGAEAELHPDMFTEVPDRAILLRLQNNIRIRLSRAGRSREVQPVLESMLALDDKDVQLWQDAVQLYLDLDEVKAAIGALEALSQLAATDTARQAFSEEISKLRNRLN